MGDRPYPEHIPIHDKPLASRFVFDASAGQTAKRQLEKKVEEAEERVSRIVRRADDGHRFKGVPLMAHILSVTTDPEELEIVANICSRMATLMPSLAQLRQRLHTVSTAIEDPAFLADIFGDFSTSFADHVPDEIENP